MEPGATAPTVESDPRARLVIVFIDTGYKYDLEEAYGAKLRLLSRIGTGEVITFGEAKVLPLGAFTVRSSHVLGSKFAMTLRSLATAWSAIRCLRRFDGRVDLIVAHDALTTGVLGAILSLAWRIPLAVEINGDYTAWSNFAHIRIRWLRVARRLIYQQIAAVVLMRARGVKTLFQRQAQNLGIRRSATRHISAFPNFLELNQFSNLGESKTVVIVGFPFVVKGVDIALAAFQRIAGRFPDWRMEVLGWYTGAEKQLLDSAIGDHPRIRHRDPIPRRDMPAYIGSAGIVVCASRTEGFPRCIKEAMYAGKACVVSDVGGLPDVIRDGLNGLMFRSEDEAGLSECLARLMSDPQLRHRLGAAAIEAAHLEFSEQQYLRHFAMFALGTIRASGRQDVPLLKPPGDG